jgi:hypothetical protein
MTYQISGSVLNGPQYNHAEAIEMLRPASRAHRVTGATLDGRTREGFPS